MVAARPGPYNRLSASKPMVKTGEMPDPEPRKTMTFETATELGKWLEAHHARETELWVKIYKRGSGIPSVTWNDVVMETLCWGWIDGVKKSLGEDAYLQRITPRKPRSTWSKTNARHVERLIEEGRMQEAGLVHVRAAKADGRWDAAYGSSREMEVPADFLTALENEPQAKQFFETLGKSSRYVIAYGLATAKRPETRSRRLRKFLDMLARQEKPDFFKKRT